MCTYKLLSNYNHTIRVYAVRIIYYIIIIPVLNLAEYVIIVNLFI